MRGWKEQLAHEASEKKRMRAEWVQQAAELGMGVKGAAMHLGIDHQQLQNLFSKHGIKMGRKVGGCSDKKDEAQRMQVRISRQLRERAKAKIAAGYKPEYARREAALEMQMEATR